MIFKQNNDFIEKITKEIQDTPCYIFNDNLLYKKISEIKENLPKCSALCFAMKANPFLVKSINAIADRIEACSPGEYEICYNHGIDPSKIIISGVNKTKKSMERIMSISNGKGIYTIESPLHYEILSSLAAEKQLHIDVMLRLSSGNQFGVDRESFCNILNKLKSDKYCSFRGIHYFSGTQKKIKKIQKELASLDDFAGEIKNNYNIPFIELEYGPGLSVSYFENDDTVDFKEQLLKLNIALSNLSNFDKIGIELGRFIAADCGFFMTKVIDTKITEGSKYVIIDGGIHQLHYFGQMMGMKVPHILQIPERENCIAEKNIICGSLCSVNDVIVRDAELKNLSIGDTLIFALCGAYSMTESSSLFLSRELPAVYEYKKDKNILCLREKSETYLLNTERYGD